MLSDAIDVRPTLCHHGSDVVGKRSLQERTVRRHEGKITARVNLLVGHCWLHFGCAARRLYGLRGGRADVHLDVLLEILDLEALVVAEHSYVLECTSQGTRMCPRRQTPCRIASSPV